MSYKKSEAASRLKGARREYSKTGSGAFGKYVGIGSGVVLIILLLTDKITGIEFGVGILLALCFGFYGADLIKRNKQASGDVKRLEDSEEVDKGSGS